MQTLDDVDVMTDARRVLCGILYRFDTTGKWPTARQLFQLSGYKAAQDKSRTMSWLIQGGYVRFEDEPSSSRNGRPKRTYIATEKARLLVVPPTPQPEIKPDRPVPFPKDEVESAIYQHILMWYRQHGRWPNGVERAMAFEGNRSALYSKERRRAAYKKLHDDGTFVHVTFRNGKGDSTFYIMPRISPEYADKDGWVFYAPAIPA